MVKVRKKLNSFISVDRVMISIVIIILGIMLRIPGQNSAKISENTKYISTVDNKITAKMSVVENDIGHLTEDIEDVKNVVDGIRDNMVTKEDLRMIIKKINSNKE